MIKYKKICPSATWSLTVADTYGTVVKHTVLELWDSNSNAVAGLHIASYCGFKRYNLLWIDGSTYIHFNSSFFHRIVHRLKELDLRRSFH